MRLLRYPVALAVVLGLVALTAWALAWPFEKAAYLAPIIVVGGATDTEVRSRVRGGEDALAAGRAAVRGRSAAGQPSIQPRSRDVGIVREVLDPAGPPA